MSKWIFSLVLLLFGVCHAISLDALSALEQQPRGYGDFPRRPLVGSVRRRGTGHGKKVSKQAQQASPAVVGRAKKTAPEMVGGDIQSFDETGEKKEGGDDTITTKDVNDFSSQIEQLRSIHDTLNSAAVMLPALEKQATDPVGKKADEGGENENQKEATDKEMATQADAIDDKQTPPEENKETVEENKEENKEVQAPVQGPQALGGGPIIIMPSGGKQPGPMNAVDGVPKEAGAQGITEGTPGVTADTQSQDTAAQENEKKAEKGPNQVALPGGAQVIVNESADGKIVDVKVNQASGSQVFTSAA